MCAFKICLGRVPVMARRPGAGDLESLAVPAEQYEATGEPCRKTRMTPKCCLLINTPT